MQYCCCVCGHYLPYPWIYCAVCYERVGPGYVAPDNMPCCIECQMQSVAVQQREVEKKHRRMQRLRTLNKMDSKEHL